MPSLIAPVTELSEEPPSISGRSLEELVSSGAERREEERSHALKLLGASRNEQSVTLPILATAGDVREVVQYLRKKPTGVSVVEASGDVKKRVFQPRKIAAYEFWGIISRQGGDRLHLTQLGWEFARKLAPETEAYRAVLDQTAPYRAVLEWISRESLDLATHKDVAAFWQRLGHLSPGQNHKTIEASVVCFFHLCQAAELGTVTIGKRGQPARLRVEREELNAFVEGRPLTQAIEPDLAEVAPSGFALPSERIASPATAAVAAAAAERIRFLIAGGAATQTVSHLQSTLELMEIEHRTIVVGEEESFPYADEVFAAMRQCAAGMIVVTPDDCHTDETGASALKQRMLHLINTSFVLYDRRVALLWDKRIAFPIQLSSLPNFSLEGDELTWAAGVKMMRVIKDFQRQARASDSAMP
jgi:hypothetical protein